MRVFLLLILITCISQSLNAQNTAVVAKTSQQLYNPLANAEEELNAAKQKAAASQKHVLAFIGGNWCPWCVRLNKFISGNDSLKAVLQDNYEVVYINYSKEQKNEKVLQALSNPNRFGFPVIVILDNKGRNIMTQNTGLLESGNSYDAKKVYEFLSNWTYSALNK